MITAEQILAAIRKHTQGGEGYIHVAEEQVGDAGQYVPVNGLRGVTLDLDVDLEAVAKTLNGSEHPAKATAETHIRIGPHPDTYCGAKGGTVSEDHVMLAMQGSREDIRGHVARLPERLCTKCLAKVRKPKT